MPAVAVTRAWPTAPVVAGEPEMLAELAYQRDEEMAVRPEDFLLRRTRLGLYHAALLADQLERHSQLQQRLHVALPRVDAFSRRLDTP